MRRFLLGAGLPLLLMMLMGGCGPRVVAFQQSTRSDGGKVMIISVKNIAIDGFDGDGSGGSPVNITDAAGTFEFPNEANPKIILRSDGQEMTVIAYEEPSITFVLTIEGQGDLDGTYHFNLN